jgi:DNA adenine methylase
MNDRHANKEISRKPFLKWPGGKRWVSEFIKSMVKVDRYRRYLEPFLGGGAIFFTLAPNNSILSDINEELIVTYQQVRDQPEILIEKLRKIPVSLPTYNEMRDQKPLEALDQAVRFLYLNRTAFAGMYRVNRGGKFNVPFGGGQRTPAVLWKDGLITVASEALENAKIICCDFMVIMTDARRGDLVYCDPTYTTSHSNNGFIRYNERNFSWKDQERLAMVSRQAAKRGATVIVSNAYNKDIRKLYTDAKAIKLTRMSLICPNISKRKLIEEYLFIYNG